LLAELAARHPMLRSESLSKSWRSSSVVLDAVELCFRAIDENPVFASEEDAPLREAAAHWRAGFTKPVAARELAGAALMFQAPPTEGERPALSVLRLAVERVAALVAEAPGATIGVLLRRNADLPLLLSRLLQRGIRASGEGGNPLTDSDAVLVFLSLLHLADHPRDGAAAFHVATSPIGLHLGLAPRASDVQRATLSRVLRERLALEGYGTFAASLLPVVADARERWSDWDRRRYERLVEMAHAFDARAGLRPVDFAEHVRAERVDEPSAASVRVMTVHASKGL
jgi:ATP-dependent exoDNAse (exonuclease V) beta subunit